MVKRKPKQPAAPPPKPPVHERMREVWYKHPVAIVSGIGVFIATAASAVPAARWLVEHLDAPGVELRMQKQLDEHKLSDARTSLWSTVIANKHELALVDAKVVAIRNRVNDCRIAKDRGKPMTTLEISACNQYEEELLLGQKEHEITARRLEKSRETAKEASDERKK